MEYSQTISKKTNKYKTLESKFKQTEIQLVLQLKNII